MADDDRHAGYRNALSQHFRILTIDQPMMRRENATMTAAQ